MITPLIFDQVTGAIVWNKELLPAQPEGLREIIETVIELALINQNAAAIDLVNELDGEDRLRAISFLSSVWHEKRHFADWLITNHMAFEFRTVIKTYINLGTVLMDCEGKRYAFPFDYNLDAVKRGAWELSDPKSPYVLQLMNQLKNMRHKNNRDSVKVETGRHPFTASGNTLLEAIAFHTQLNCIVAAFGRATMLEWYEHHRETIDKGLYQWMDDILINGLSVMMEGDDPTARYFYSPVFIPLAYAALAIQTDGGDAGFVLFRLSKLVTAVRGELEKDSIETVAGAWELVNRICKEEFGRSVLESIEADISVLDRIIAMADTAETSQENNPGFKIAKAYQEQRKRAFNVLTETPEVFLDTFVFYDRLLPELYPVPVYIAPSGESLDVHKDDHVHWKNEGNSELSAMMEKLAAEKMPGLNFSLHVSWGWTPAHWSKQRGAFIFADLPDWLNIIGTFGPVTKIFMNGFKERSLIGPEIPVIIGMFKSFGLDLYVPVFNRSRLETSDATLAALLFLTNQSQLKCDFCSCTMQGSEAEIISPWELREDQELLDRWQRLVVVPEFVRDLLTVNWSYWIVHKGACPANC